VSDRDSTRAADRLPTRDWCVPVGLVVLFTVGAMVESVRLASLQNAAVWGHLRDGMWILQNRTVPRSGIFSRAANLPWRDFSWGYDAIVAATYKITGLRAVPLLAMGFRVIVTAVSFLLADRRRGKFLWAAGLAGLGLYTMAGLGPTSAGVSAILLGIELLLLLEWRKGRDSGVMFVLPVLFLIWANLDIGFVYGMMVFALFVMNRFALQYASTGEIAAGERKLARNAVVLFAGCLIVSGITPYGFASYPAFWQMATSTANLSIPGYGAMGFRQTLDYAVLLLGMGAFLAMGLKRSRDIFLVVSLCGSTALLFHSQRENWLLIVTSIAVIGEMVPNTGHAGESKAVWAFSQRPSVIAGFTLVTTGLLFFVLVPRDPKVLIGRVAETLPVKACDFIRTERLPQPLFNAYEWGAFLTWYLPEYPVAIDGRRGLYPEELESGYFKVMKVDLPYQSLPAMRDAQTMLLEKSNVVAGGLKDVPGFRVAYEDELAIVLLHSTRE
jgi:hypothetical protein